MDAPKTDLNAQSILALLAEHREQLYALGARKRGLFGSFARGEQTPTSDIDILVTMARLSYNDYSSIRFYLEDLFGRKVDLVPEKDLRPGIRTNIMQGVIYIEDLA